MSQMQVPVCYLTYWRGYKVPCSTPFPRTVVKRQKMPHRASQDAVSCADREIALWPCHRARYCV